MKGIPGGSFRPQVPVRSETRRPWTSGTVPTRDRPGSGTTSPPGERGEVEKLVVRRRRDSGLGRPTTRRAGLGRTGSTSEVLRRRNPPRPHVPPFGPSTPLWHLSRHPTPDLPPRRLPGLRRWRQPDFGSSWPRTPLVRQGQPTPDGAITTVTWFRNCQVFHSSRDCLL